MKYFSLDIETSSLTPDPENVISLGLVFEDTETNLPMDQLPSLHLLFLHKLKDTDNVAMAMNSELLWERSGLRPTNKTIVKDWDEAKPIIQAFIYTHASPHKQTLAGKNVGVFDYQFLPKDVKKLFNHRMLDPGSMFILPVNTKIPDQAECLNRAGLVSTVTHDAIDDAKQVIQLIRAFFQGK